MIKFDQLKRINENSIGLVPVIIQDWKSYEVLMLGFMNKQSFEKTIKSKRTWFWSRSRGKLWNKGEESGNYQIVKAIKIDCDSDTMLMMVEQVNGITCHKGKRSCFS
jgi:phosphoribosyl-AMP cyclohydrolase